MSLYEQPSKTFIHWCKDPTKKDIGLKKRRETISSKYTSEDISKLKQRAVASGYSKLNQMLDSITIYEKEKFLDIIRNIDINQFCGRSGNRSLLKYDPVLYKSLITYTEFITEFSTKAFFVLRLKVAKNNLILDDKMKCRCGLRTSFDPKTQNFTKHFCKSCILAHRSKAWFNYFYGDTIGEIEYTKYMTLPDTIAKRQYSGRKSFEARSKRLFRGCLSKGKNEQAILDFISSVNNIKIERGYPVDGYYLDGYCKDQNIAYEVYEQYHNSKSQSNYDIIRQQYIVNKLRCQFIIIKDNTKKPLNLDQLTIEVYNV